MSEPRVRWPKGVYGGGQEPDPRFSLANERTFLAWIRTALAFLAGAAAVHAFDLSVSAAVERAVAGMLATAGLASAVQAWFGWARTEKALRHDQPLPSNVVGIPVVVMVAAVSLVLIAVVVRG